VDELSAFAISDTPAFQSLIAPWRSDLLHALRGKPRLTPPELISALTSADTRELLLAARNLGYVFVTEEAKRRSPFLTTLVQKELKIRLLGQLDQRDADDLIASLAEPADGFYEADADLRGALEGYFEVRRRYLTKEATTEWSDWLAMRDEIHHDTNQSPGEREVESTR
jgi:hypothetical protein